MRQAAARVRGLMYKTMAIGSQVPRLSVLVIESSAYARVIFFVSRTSTLVFETHTKGHCDFMKFGSHGDND